MESEDSKLLNIHVTICDRPYRLKVRPEEEETVRKAARAIAEKIKELQGMYSGSDKQDLLAMSLLMTMVERPHTQVVAESDNTNLDAAIDALNQQIAEALQS